MTMSPIGAAELQEGRKAARVVADPRVFPAIVAAAAMGFVGLLMFWQRQDAREFQAAMVAALREQTQAIQKLTDELRMADRRR